MDKKDTRYQAYLSILEKELIPAMGCTEPIALAYAAAKARDVLGRIPDKIRVEASGSIIKNVKSVIVPNTDGLKGIPAAVAAGIVAGNPEKELEVISQVDGEKKQAIRSYMDTTPISVGYLDEGHEFDLIVRAYAGLDESSGSTAESGGLAEAIGSAEAVDVSTAESAGLAGSTAEAVGLTAESTESTGSESKSVRLEDESGDSVLVRITDQHTNIVLIKKNESTVYEQTLSEVENTDSLYQLLSIKGIWEFIQSLDPEDVRPLLERQISYNMAIAEEGIRGDYGACIGKVLLDSFGDSVENRAKAMAAAGSDARMNGCELPVVINSGSGNQGITCCVPVVVYAQELGCSRDKLLRALALSNLTAIYAKTGIGTLSAYCGAVSAGSGAGAGIAYLHHENYEDVIHTIVNSLAIVSGIVCDGAKASCAAKIASSVDAAILGYHMYQHGQEFKGGDGIVMRGIEPTIRSIGRLGKEGMRETNKEIIKIMLEDE